MNPSLLIEALSQPFLDPVSRTWWGGLAITAALAAAWAGPHRGRRLLAGAALLRHRSCGLDLQMFLGRQLLRLLFGAPAAAGAWLLATRLVRWLDGAVGAPPTPELPAVVVSAVYSLALFIAWDASRFALHWLMHRLPWLWAFHQVHHSAEVLTPLTFHRLHPLESWLYDLRGVLVTGLVAAGFYWLFREGDVGWTLLGVPAIGFALNVVFGNLRHSHIWMRFPPAVERWLISPAQHQLHHADEPALYGKNYGTWLAVWDRLAGTLALAEAPPARFGVPAAERNHRDDLLSAWFGPFLAIARGLRGASPAAAIALLGIAGAPGAAAEPEDDAGARPAMGGEIIVTPEDGTPRIAGSAYEVSQEQLELVESNNIEQVLAGAPGVSTRSEDGHGLRPNIGIRGANSDRSAKVTLMEDGVLLAPAPYAAPAAYYFPMTTRMVGVEIFKGPAATRHGPNTVGGALNLLTRGIPDGRAFDVDAAVGAFRTVKGHVWAGAGDEDAGVLVEGVHLRSDGFKVIDGDPADSDASFNHTEVMLKGRLSPWLNHALELKLGYARELDHETYLGLTRADLEVDPYRRYAATGLALMDWDRSQAELTWSARAGEVDLRTTAYHHWFSRSWRKFNAFESGVDLHDLLQQDPDSGQGAVWLAILRGEEDSGSPDQALQIGTNDRRYHAFGLQSAARWALVGERAESVLDGGVRLHGDHVLRDHAYETYDMRGGALVATGEPEVVTLESVADARALAAYLHEDLTVGWLHLLPGARVEVIWSERVDEGAEVLDPVIRTSLLPGMGALAELGQWVQLFGGAHRGFSPVAPGQPEEVEPELSWNYEAGARFAQGDRRVEVVGFFNDYVNLTGECTFSGGCDNDDVGQQFNGGQVWVYGVEVVAGVALLLPGELSMPVEGTYAWTRSVFHTGFQSDFDQFGTVEVGDSLPYVPEHQGGARVGLMHPRVKTTLGVSARSGMLDEAGVFPIEDTDVPGIWLLDAAISGRVTPRVSVYATGSNLNGSTALTSWRPLGARPTAPRQVMLGVKVGSPEPW